jgi:hypothetical protein
MKASESTQRVYGYLFPLLFALLTLAALHLMNALVFPLALFTLGFFVAGLVFPDVLDELVGFGHTLWLPLGFTALGFAGLYIQFGADAFKIVTTSTWCGMAPCTPVGMVFVAFALGNMAVLASDFLSGKKVDLFGDKQKEPK